MRRVAFAMSLLCLGWVLTAGVARARPASAEDEVMAADHARGDALLHQDYAALDKIMADDVIYCHASGKIDSKASYLAAMHADTLHYYSIDSSGMHARVDGKMAVLNGPVSLRVRNGTPEARDLKLQSTAVYEKRDGRWQLISYQSTALAATPSLQPAK
jgi:ketosteroid isomerase-like protein